MQGNFFLNATMIFTSLYILKKKCPYLNLNDFVIHFVDSAFYEWMNKFDHEILFLGSKTEFTTELTATIVKKKVNQF